MSTEADARMLIDRLLEQAYRSTGQGKTMGQFRVVDTSLIDPKALSQINKTPELDELRRQTYLLEGVNYELKQNRMTG